MITVKTPGISNLFPILVSYMSVKHFLNLNFFQIKKWHSNEIKNLKLSQIQN